MSYIADIAEAVKDAINASAIASSEDFEAIRVYVPQKDYSTAEDLIVQVFPLALERPERFDRDRTRNNIEIDVVFAKRIDQLTDPTVEAGNVLLDPLMEIGEALLAAVVVGDVYADARCVRTEFDPVYDFELLRSHRVFVGLVKAFFLYV